MPRCYCTSRPAMRGGAEAATKSGVRSGDSRFNRNFGIRYPAAKEVFNTRCDFVRSARKRPKCRLHCSGATRRASLHGSTPGVCVHPPHPAAFAWAEQARAACDHEDPRGAAALREGPSCTILLLRGEDSNSNNSDNSDSSSRASSELLSCGYWHSGSMPVCSRLVGDDRDGLCCGHEFAGLEGERSFTSSWATAPQSPGIDDWKG